VGRRILESSRWPDQIVIDRSVYRLEVTKEIEDHGTYNADKRLIQIRPSDPVEDLDTLFHEFFHGCEHEYFINLTHRQVYQLARATSRFILDNPNLFEAVLPELSE